MKFLSCTMNQQSYTDFTNLTIIIKYLFTQFMLLDVVISILDYILSCLHNYIRHSFNNYNAHVVASGVDDTYLQIKLKAPLTIKL